MPLYEYSCAECGTYGSTSSSYVDNLPIMECPKCMTIMNRLYSAPGIVFKGTGWGSKS
jgi:putative FmdB family regulatory protein